MGLWHEPGISQELAAYWQNEFDWTAQETAINQFKHYRAEVDGFGIHFIHEPGKGPNPMPLLLSHGWPSTFLEFSKIIPLLTDPASYGGKAEDAFEVIVPSLPGFGFSDRPGERGMSTTKIADLFARLVTEELGFKKFAAQGGDFGSSITEAIAMGFPDALTGIHMNDVPYHYAMQQVENPSPAVQEYLQQSQQWQWAEGGYAMIQSSKPQTLGYGLNDSPSGLAGWIVEKYRAWSDCDGDVEKRFSKDETLANVTIYWATQTITSSARLYYETGAVMGESEDKGKDRVPTAVNIFPKDILPPPPELVEGWFAGATITTMPRGGHFAAHEEPKLLAESIRDFYRPLRLSGGYK